MRQTEVVDELIHEAFAQASSINHLKHLQRINSFQVHYKAKHEATSFRMLQRWHMSGSVQYLEAVNQA